MTEDQPQRREYKECDCECHHNDRVMHIMPCCGGKCIGCGKYYHNLKDHQELCTLFRLKVSLKAKTSSRSNR